MQVDHSAIIALNQNALVLNDIALAVEGDDVRQPECLAGHDQQIAALDGHVGNRWIANDDLARRPRQSQQLRLVIDDNEVDLFINEALLHEIKLSREVRRELSPANMISQLKNTNKLSDVPELIILDMNMEKKDGYSFLDEFRGLSDFIRNKCKIVIVSSTDLNEDKHRVLMNPNVIRYLVKPIDAFQLKEIM